jgi:arylsulfatase A-like enzyme
LLFYAPGLLKPQRISNVCSQIDIMPTIASLANIPYRNNALGRNLFDTIYHDQNKTVSPRGNYAFVIDHDVHSIGMVSDQYYYLKNLKTGKEQMVSMRFNEPVPVNAETDTLKNYLQRLTDAYYETAKYLLLNNKKKP